MLSVGSPSRRALVLGAGGVQDRRRRAHVGKIWAGGFFAGGCCALERLRSLRLSLCVGLALKLSLLQEGRGGGGPASATATALFALPRKHCAVRSSGVPTQLRPPGPSAAGASSISSASLLSVDRSQIGQAHSPLKRAWRGSPPPPSAAARARRRPHPRGASRPAGAETGAGGSEREERRCGMGGAHG